jgi:micrococcal nuclease
MKLNNLSILFIWLLLLYFPFTPCSAKELLQGLVISIEDGDTITILRQDKVKVRVQFYGIDCPEMDQPFGKEAKQFTSDMVLKKNVNIFQYGADQHGRSEGVVSVEGINVNEQLIKVGLAWQYRKYCKEAFCGKWKRFEDEARKGKIGLWRDTAPVPPWDRQKSTWINTFHR